MLKGALSAEQLARVFVAMRRVLGARHPSRPEKPSWEELGREHQLRALAIARLALENPQQTPSQLHARLPPELGGPFEVMHLALAAMLAAARALDDGLPKLPPGSMLN